MTKLMKTNSYKLKNCYSFFLFNNCLKTHYLISEFFLGGKLENRKNWLEKCEDILKQNKNKKFIIVGGSSSAGKTYKCKLMKKYFEKQNKKCLMISLDNFYKPLSLRLTEQVINKNKDLIHLKDEIHKIIYNNTKDFEYNKKFERENVKNILKNLLKITDKKTAFKILKQVYYDYKLINFDLPSAIDFENIAKQLNSQQITLPNYSFKTNEILTDKIVKYNANDYDYIIVEGIFALQEDLLKKLDKDKILTVGLKCDLTTMLSRRLYRDIFKETRTRDPKQTFESYFKQVMPCYNKYIKDTLNNVDIKVRSIITNQEIMEKSIKPKKFTYDFKLLDEKCHNANLYLKLSNNKPDKLIFEYKMNKQNLIETYDLKNQFKQENTKTVLNYFKKAGFTIKKKHLINEIEFTK